MLVNVVSGVTDCAGPKADPATPAAELNFHYN